MLTHDGFFMALAYFAMLFTSPEVGLVFRFNRFNYSSISQLFPLVMSNRHDFTVCTRPLFCVWQRSVSKFEAHSFHLASTCIYSVTHTRDRHIAPLLSRASPLQTLFIRSAKLNAVRTSALRSFRGGFATRANAKERPRRRAIDRNVLPFP